MSDKNEDILKSFIGKETDIKTEKVSKGYNLDMDNVKESMVYGREFISIDINSLPAGLFYKPGTRISIKAANVSDVQEYSVVDNTNIVDVTEKMNLMLSRCVRFLHPNGTKGSYKNLKDNDRLFIIFMIRELTFQKGNNLAKDVKCGECSHKFKIEFRATNSESMKRTFVNHEIDSELMEFFNDETRTFDLEMNNKLWKLSPPSIGIQEVFFDNLKLSMQLEDSEPNVAFLKMIPFILWNKEKISENEIKEQETIFQSMDMDTFQVLNYMISKMENIGIKELVSTCPVCGAEVRTTMSFPGRASDIFVDASPLAKLKKK